MTSNTLVLRFRDAKVFGANVSGPKSIREGVVSLILESSLMCSSENPEDEIQCISVPSPSHGGIQQSLDVSVTMYDVRNTQGLFMYSSEPSVRAKYNLDDVYIDMSGGSNRSIIIPKTTSFSLDSVYTRFSNFGHIEKVWFTDETSITIDFLDARAPMRIRTFIENPPQNNDNNNIQLSEPVSFPSNDQLSGILTGIY